MKYSLDYSVFKLEFFANFYVVLMSQKLVYIYIRYLAMGLFCDFLCLNVFVSYLWGVRLNKQIITVCAGKNILCSYSF